MKYIGIDMSKDTFHACFDDGKVEVFKNTRDGIQTFERVGKGKEHKKKETIIGIEATGVYHHLFCLTVSKNGWTVMIINPLLVSQMIRDGLRMVKNDVKDARIIREAVMQGKGYRFTDTSEILALKALVSERADLVEMRGDLKRRQHAHEMREVACDTSLHDSYGTTFVTLTKEIKIIEKQMKCMVPETQELLRSIPGIGITASALLVAFVGDIKRFDHPDKLVAYIGIDPRVKQSGTSIHSKGPITKRGNALLRHVLYQSAFIAKRHNLVFGRYYAKKKGEGKHHTSVLCALERKLIHTIWAVWKRGTPFEER